MNNLFIFDKISLNNGVHYTGRLIDKVELKSGMSFNYDSSHLEKGIYTVALYVNTSVKDTKKLVIIK